MEQSVAGLSDTFVAKQLTAELNMLITGPRLVEGGEGSDVKSNRSYLVALSEGMIAALVSGGEPIAIADMTILDVLLNDELRQDFIKECENLLLFDAFYDEAIGRLETIAHEAQTDQMLSLGSAEKLIDGAVSAAGLMLNISVSDPVGQAALKNQLFDWYQRILKMPKGSEFFRTVEEWKKLSFAHLADALFVIVTYFFSTLFNSYVVA